MSSLKFTDTASWRAIERHLTTGQGERFAFAHARLVTRIPSGPVLEVIGIELISDTDVYRDDHGWYLADAALDRVHNTAIANRHSLVEFHSHRLGPPRFSRTDEAGLKPMAAYATQMLPGGVYGAGIYADGALHVDWWTQTDTGEPHRGTFTTVAVIGDRMELLNAPTERHRRTERQEPLIGPDGQAVISAMRVALVGAGGTGSHMAQALAYLGFRDIRIFDDDMVDESNLNRMVTAGPADIGAPKNKVTQSHIQRIDPNISVVPHPVVTPESDGVELSDVDLLIGCVDHDGPRDLLNQIAVTTRTPYVDIATGVDATINPPVIGGRAIFVLPGGPCLHCHNELDPSEISRWAKPQDQQDLDRRHGYGTGLPNAAVIHLNGMTVYAAVTELIAWIAGTRQPAQYLDVDASGYLTHKSETPGVRVAPRLPVTQKPSCIACSCLR